MNRRNPILSLALWGAIVFWLGPQTGLARIWTSNDGRFKTEAELLDATNTEVRLKRTDGGEITVLLEKLSDQDQRHVASWKRRRAKSPDKQAAPVSSRAAASAKTNEPKLAPLDFKIFEDELTMQAPVGAKVEVQGVFPVVRFGKRFVMWIEPHSESDLKDFKERFRGASDALALQKVLVEEDDALAYTVNVKAFNATASAYMAVVTIGDKKYTCADESMEDMNRTQKYSAQDIELMIRCARTLKAKGSTSETADARPDQSAVLLSQ